MQRMSAQIWRRGRLRFNRRSLLPLRAGMQFQLRVRKLGKLLFRSPPHGRGISDRDGP